MTPYPHYKPSGIPWIGHIPKHWEVKRLKYVALAQPSNVDKKVNEGELPVQLCNYVDVYKNDYITGELNFMKATATENEIQKFKLHYGDVIITKDSETPEEIAIPALVKHEAEDLICGYHLTQIKADRQKLLGEYLFRLFQTKMFNANFEAAATGVTRFALSSDVIKDVQVLLPPLPEQTAIAQYLDTKTAQLDKLIANKQKLIQLLREERTAFINQAVSGEGKGWEKKKLKYVGKAIIGITYSPSDVTPDYTGLLVLRSSNIQEGKLSFLDNVYVKTEISNKHLTKEGDILICARNGSAHLVGKCALIDKQNENKTWGAFMTIFRSSYGNFLYYYFNSDLFRRNIGHFSTSTVFQLTSDTLHNLEVALPPSKEEINEIVSLIQTETQRIDVLIAKTEKEIELMQEYKTALISEVVTGKVKVTS